MSTGPALSPDEETETAPDDGGRWLDGRGPLEAAGPLLDAAPPDDEEPTLEGDWLDDGASDDEAGGPPSRTGTTHDPVSSLQARLPPQGASQHGGRQAPA